MNRYMWKKFKLSSRATLQGQANWLYTPAQGDDESDPPIEN